MKIKLANFIIIVLIISVAFVSRKQIENLIKYNSIYSPCDKPITYALGSFDDRFGLSKQDFLSAVEEAETIWEQPIGKELFTYDTVNGNLKINLIYDYRQQATSKLKSLGIAVNEDNASYDDLKAKYNALNAGYTQAKANYNARLALFNQRQNAYNQEVQSWNKKGGIPKDEYDRLQIEEAALQAELANIKKLEAGLNEYIDEINSLAVVLNRLVAVLNLNVGNYNEIGASRGEEFTEGDYQSSSGEQDINVYEFSSYDKLVRLLAHELGHALGLAHVEDSEAIMYKFNTSVNEKLTSSDIGELKAICSIK